MHPCCRAHWFVYLLPALPQPSPSNSRTCCSCGKMPCLLTDHATHSPLWVVGAGEECEDGGRGAVTRLAMVSPGVEVGIQQRFINKMEERSPSLPCLPAQVDMDLLMGPFRGLCCSCEQRSPKGARSPGPRCKCVGLKLTGQRTGGSTRGSETTHKIQLTSS